MGGNESIASPRIRSILIADDDVIFRMVTSELVRSWGYDSTEVADGEAALQILLQDRPPTIAILDWLMPKLTGPEICRCLRTADARQYIYFILVSARDGREDSIEGLRSGADSYISKPLDAEELRTKLEIANRIVSMEESLRDLHAETELFINAVEEVVGDGAQGKGRITIRTSWDSDWAQIAISDTGRGIPEEIRERIFEPFFSTKPVGKVPARDWLWLTRQSLRNRRVDFGLSPIPFKEQHFSYAFPSHSEWGS